VSNARVVPSQVFAFIKAIFPDETLDGNTVGRGNAGELAGLVDLVDKIPEELLTMSAEDYALLISSKGHIRERLASWSHDRSSRNSLDFIRGQSPIRLIRAALAQCPDEAPSVSTSELKFITDTDLRANLRNDIGAVTRALSNGEWKAATVLAGSAAEALLLWALKQRTAAEITSAIAALKTSGNLTTKPDANLDWWNLYEFIQVAENLGVIKPNTAKQTRLAKDFRNFIHPGVAQRLGEKCDRATALSAVAGMEHVVRDLS
jgi:hypothetical protein